MLYDQYLINYDIDRAYADLPQGVRTEVDKFVGDTFHVILMIAGYVYYYATQIHRKYGIPITNIVLLGNSLAFIAPILQLLLESQGIKIKINFIPWSGANSMGGEDPTDKQTNIKQKYMYQEIPPSQNTLIVDFTSGSHSSAIRQASRLGGYSHTLGFLAHDMRGTMPTGDYIFIGKAIFELANARLPGPKSQRFQNNEIRIVPKHNPDQWTMRPKWDNPEIIIGAAILSKIKSMFVQYSQPPYDIERCPTIITERDRGLW